MQNGSLKDHLHSNILSFFCPCEDSYFWVMCPLSDGYSLFHNTAPGKAPLNWKMRVQIAIDVANALVLFSIVYFIFTYFANAVET